MAEGFPRSKRKQVPSTDSPVYSSVCPFCLSFTPGLASQQFSIKETNNHHESILEDFKKKQQNVVTFVVK